MRLWHLKVNDASKWCAVGFFLYPLLMSFTLSVDIKTRKRKKAIHFWRYTLCLASSYKRMDLPARKRLCISSPETGTTCSVKLPCCTLIFMRFLSYLWWVVRVWIIDIPSYLFYRICSFWGLSTSALTSQILMLFVLKYQFVCCLIRFDCTSIYLFIYSSFWIFYCKGVLKQCLLFIRKILCSWNISWSSNIKIIPCFWFSWDFYLCGWKSVHFQKKTVWTPNPCFRLYVYLPSLRWFN